MRCASTSALAQNWYARTSLKATDYPGVPSGRRSKIESQIPIRSANAKEATINPPTPYHARYLGVAISPKSRVTYHAGKQGTQTAREFAFPD
jgi:hypothetical protein